MESCDYTAVVALSPVYSATLNEDPEDLTRCLHGLVLPHSTLKKDVNNFPVIFGFYNDSH